MKIMKFKFKNREFECGKTSRLMGILNVTPDSFSDGSQFTDPQKAVDHALEMHEAGADIIDVGGESTRPGAPEVSVEEEIKRVIPIFTKLKAIKPEIVISIDTTKSEVAEAALSEGADIINDISGLQYDSEIAKSAAKYNAGLILMHMRGTPATMKSLCEYDNLICEIRNFLDNVAKKAVAAGVPRENIMLDPGIGFAKNTEQNIEIMREIEFFSKTGFPVLVGPSRKSFIGDILNRVDPRERIWGTAGAVAWLAMKKVAFIRVHDVKKMKDVIRVIQTVGV
jgi:dihydropteroate synthase